MERNLSRVHLIRFEALLDDPRRCVESLAAYLDLDPGAFDTSFVRRPDSKPDQLLDHASRTAVEEVAGEAMGRWGYDRT
jgi:hypothetical protein